MTYKAKDSLLSRLVEIVLLLNGEYRGGKRAVFASDFATARYAITLLAAIMNYDIFSDHLIKVRKETFCNFYRLEKIANRFHLQFDRTRIAEKIFEQLENKGEVKKLVKDNKTYITLTKKGKETTLRMLERLCELNRLFYMNPLMQFKFSKDYYIERGQGKDSILEERSPIETKIDDLIKSIANWE